MALSNWDTFAVDLNGEAQAGFFVSPGGVKVEIYKNWIYVHDPKAWREMGGFVKDTVMEIGHGNVRYHDVHVTAIRGPQDGVYVVCWHEKYEQSKLQLTGMIGCGVSGFEGEDWVGVTLESVRFLQAWISTKERTFSDEAIDVIVTDDDDKIKQELREDYSYDFLEEIAAVQLVHGVRYNQGDRYFAEKIGTPLSATRPGEPVRPILS